MKNSPLIVERIFNAPTEKVWNALLEEYQSFE